MVLSSNQTDILFTVIIVVQRMTEVETNNTTVDATDEQQINPPELSSHFVEEQGVVGLSGDGGDEGIEEGPLIEGDYTDALIRNANDTSDEEDVRFLYATILLCGNFDSLCIMLRMESLFMPESLLGSIAPHHLSVIFFLLPDPKDQPWTLLHLAQPIKKNCKNCVLLAK
jgi:hypothetical protein